MSGRIAIVLLVILSWIIIVLSHASGAESGAPGAFVIDVRTVMEWKLGHLDGAVRIPYDRIGNDIGSFTNDKNAKLYVYCRSGRRSAIAVETLRKSGYVNLVDLGSMENASKALGKKVIR